ncbi:amidohydrolase [Wenyingzhuangia sp. IMCC45533]
MQNSLNVTLMQTDIQWKDSQANMVYLDSQISPLKTDLIVLPEMFNTGFCMDAKDIAEPMDGNVVTWMIKKARELNCAICGSVSVTENNNYYNRFLFVTPKGIEDYYDKKHLFSYGKEDTIYAAGNTITTINYKGFKIKPFICYDLRFPVWSRNVDSYDIALYVANWPAKRAFAWNSLLTARAIENMSYVIAVNRIGIDGNHLRYQGDSKVIGPLGDEITTCKDQPTMKQITLKKDSLIATRNRFKFLEDRDFFKFDS